MNKNSRIRPLRIIFSIVSFMIGRGSNGPNELQARVILLEGEFIDCSEKLEQEGVEVARELSDCSFSTDE